MKDPVLQTIPQTCVYRMIYAGFVMASACFEPMMLPMNISPNDLELTGPFYSGFLAKKRDGSPAYGSDEQGCIERSVAKLLGQPTDAKKPGILLGKIQSG